MAEEEAPIDDDDPFDPWKLVEMARVVVEETGGPEDPDYGSLTLTEDQYKKLENAYEMWLSVPLDKKAHTIENILALAKEKGAEVEANKEYVEKIHEEAHAVYSNLPDFDSEAEFGKSIHQKAEVDEKVEEAKERGKSALLGAFGGKDSGD